MAIVLLKSGYKSATCDDSRHITLEYVYELDSTDEFIPFVFTRAKKGETKVFVFGIFHYYFVVDSVTIDRDTPPQPGGKFQVYVTMTLSLLQKNESETAPWNLPPYNLVISGVTQDESIGVFYPCEYDVLIPEGTNQPCPFVNTAGVSLEGLNTRGLVKLSFSYNIEVSQFDLGYIWSWIGKTNNSEINVVGIIFPVRTLRIESLNYELLTLETNGGNINYYRVDISLIADPDTYNKNYLNIGSHVIYNNSLHKLWRWSLLENNDLCTFYGSYYEYLQSGSDSGEEITENMFLNKYGTSISGFDINGKAVPVFRRGTLLAPADFSTLRLPTTRPEQWGQ